jgi:hypothetical protein
MLDAFHAEQPSPISTQLRSLVENAKRLSDLRSIVRDLRGGMAGLSLRGRASLERALRERFGPDANWERDRELVAKIRQRGRIQSEREYRVVQGHADAIAGDPAKEAEFLELGALLDAYMAAP